jgi:hypothetical protein
MLGLSHSVEVAIGVASLGAFLGTLVAVPLFLMKVPDDYFSRPRLPSSLALAVARNALGAAVVLLGILMLVLPGQGVLTIVVGLGILELPLKHRVVARILRNAKVHGAIDKLRRKAGRGSLRIPCAAKPC